MKCVLCEGVELADHQADEGLKGHKCAQCNGMWLTFDDYHNWLRGKGENLPEKPLPDGDLNLAGQEPVGKRMCPVCGFFLVKYHVGKGLDFSLNRCGHCAGIWFDKNEWEVMKGRNLHDDVHLIFSHNWQSTIREEEQAKALDRMWLER